MNQCKFCPEDTVIATVVDNTALQYGKKYKVRKENSDDARILPKEFRSEGEFVFLEGISGGWYPNRFKLDTDGLPEEGSSKEKEAGKPRRRMLRIKEGV